MACDYPVHSLIFIADSYHRDDWFELFKQLAASSELISNPCIGPKTNSVEKLSELRRAGVNIGEKHILYHKRFSAYDLHLVRMNFSHGEYSYHQSVIDNTRAMIKGKPLMNP